MSYVLTSDQMQYFDRYTIEKLNVSQLELISRAGNGLFEFITQNFTFKNILFLIGKGNNGKDGEFASKKLSLLEYNVVNFYVFNPDFDLLNRDYDIIVDCIFGVGLNRELSVETKEIIQIINNKSAVKIACDISSGLNATNGLIMGECFKADYTFCIQEYKLGHFLNDGIDYSGKIIKKDIGIKIFGDNLIKISDSLNFNELLKEQPRNSNKGCNGKVAVVGGSKCYLGSVLLSANALTALKCGAGYSFLAVPESLFNVYAGKNPEIIIKTLKDEKGNLIFDENDLKSLLDINALSFGMGVGVSEETFKICKYLIENYKNFLLLDADALNSISKFGLNVLRNKSCKVVLTPHVKEFSKLSGYSVKEIKENGVELAKNFAKEYGVVLVLKDCATIITDGESAYINITGTSGMAKAGSGDVLSGLSIGLINKCGKALEGAVLGSYFFGLAGEMALEKENDYTLTASDVIKALPKALNLKLKH